MFCRGHLARRQLLALLYRQELWQGIAEDTEQNVEVGSRREHGGNASE